MNRSAIVGLAVFITYSGIATALARDIKVDEKGTFVLVEFRKWVGDNPEKQPAIAEEVKEKLKAAGVEPLVILGDPEEPENPRMFRQMMLLDFKGKDPKETLATVPCAGAGIVFKDGAYERGIPIVKPDVWDARDKDKVPLPFAFRAWGALEQEKKKADIARYEKLDTVSVTFIPPPAGAGGSAGCVKLTPKGGASLLRVFLDTGAGFCFDDPEKK